MKRKLSQAQIIKFVTGKFPEMKEYVDCIVFRNTITDGVVFFINDDVPIQLRRNVYKWYADLKRQL